MNASITSDIAIESQNNFVFWWDVSGDWVEPVNHRRNGVSGVKKVYLKELGTFFVKIQSNHLYRSLRHPFGLPTVFREAAAIKACAHLGVKTPEVVFCGKRKEGDNWQAVMVTRELDGFVSMEQWLEADESHAYSDNIRPLVIQQLSQTLSVFHKARWQHGCLYPKHIFLQITQSNRDPKVEIALIDLEKSRRRMRANSASQRDMDQLKRHTRNFSVSDWLALKRQYQKMFR